MRGKIETILRSRAVGAVALGAFATLSQGAALAAEPQRLVSNPPVLQERAPGPMVEATPPRDPNEGPVLMSAAPRRGLPLSPTRDHVFDLFVTYTDGQLYNPGTGLYDKVRLRSYQGAQVDPKAPYVSPMMRVRPGDTVRVALHNKLPTDSGCAPEHMHDNGGHCFNGTNLHSHGLWVNPAGNGDNVLLSINPGVDFTYEYNIPSDHPAGTFWYHTHRHGSTALQVSSGMAGALIIMGDRLPSLTSQGDVDTLLQGMPERVLVMQQIQYACRDPAPDTNTDPATRVLGKIKTNAAGQYVCAPGDVGGIEGYDQFGPGSWPKSGRYTSVNGEIIPTFTAQQGQIERWRMIHAGVRDTISLQYFKVRPGKAGKALPKITEANEEKVISNTCGGEALPYTVIAADGLTMASGQTVPVATFQPGYRYDALVVFPEAGDYCVLDSSTPAAGTVNGLDVGRQLLGIVKVSAGTPVGDVRTWVKDALVASAEARMPDDVKAGIVADLNNGLKLSRFVPHADITPGEVNGEPQQLTFNIWSEGTPTGNVTRFGVANSLNPADARPYEAGRTDRKLVLGTVAEWTLEAKGSHPFHIHVNPFQIVSILDPLGNDVSLAGSKDPTYGPDGKPLIGPDGKPVVDPQFAGLHGVWKDTLWVKSVSNLPPGAKSGVYTITIRTRYERYIGAFVLHCHILDHEDEGMMQNVEIVLPTGPLAKPLAKHSH